MLYIIMLAIFAADQWIKWEVRTHMVLGQAISVIPQGVYLLYTTNSGGAFSIFPHARWLFLIVAALVIVGGVYTERRARLGRLTTLALGLVLGGALGNMADRAISGLVTDYVYLKFINFPIFNLADASIDVGIGIWFMQSFFGKSRASKQVES